MIAVGGLCNMAGIWMLQGQLKRAWEANNQALELATDARGRRLPVAGKALLGLGEIAREWNKLPEAVGYLEEGLQLFQTYGELGSILAYVSLARINEVRGDYAAAQEILDRARNLASNFKASQMDDDLVESYQVQLWLAMGEQTRAEALGRRRTTPQPCQLASASKSVRPGLGNSQPNAGAFLHESSILPGCISVDQSLVGCR